MRRASRGRLAVPVSWVEMRGTAGFVAGAEPGAAAAAGTGCVFGEELWPFVCGGASPLSSAIANWVLRAREW